MELTDVYREAQASVVGSLLIDISYGLVDPRVRVDK